MCERNWSGWPVGVLVLLGACAAVNGQETCKTDSVEAISSPSREFRTFGEYLNRASEAFDFYYTVEDSIGAAAKEPRIRAVKDFSAKLDFESLDAFVNHINTTAPGVKALRSSCAPEVIHFISEPLLAPDYVMDQTAGVAAYSGLLSGLPDRLGEVLNHRIKTRLTGVYRTDPVSDVETEVEVAVKGAPVRDILTMAVPLENYVRLIWTAEVGPRPAPVLIAYSGRQLTHEETILLEEGMEGYLKEMGNRLDCYFTLEDDRSAGERPGAWILDSDLYHDFDFTITSIDELVKSLDSAINTRTNPNLTKEPALRAEKVRIFRNPDHPFVVHIACSSLVSDSYVMNAQTDLDFKGNLGSVPVILESRLGPRIRSGNNQNIPRLAGLLPDVDVKIENATVREALTKASSVDGARRILWHAATYSVEGTPQTFVGYYGVSFQAAEALGYGGRTPPKAVDAPAAPKPSGVSPQK
jgi:hypothetical protein